MSIARRPLTAYPIRPFQQSDIPALVALANDNLPPVRQLTVADWRRREGAHTGAEKTLRLIAGDPPIAYLEAEDRATSVKRELGICDVELTVAREQRTLGIGTELLRRAEAFAHEHGATTVRVWFYQDGADDTGARFLSHCGYTEFQRRQTSHLDLTTFDAARFADSVAVVARQGVRILSYADLPDTDDNRRRLFALWSAFYTYSSFEDWHATYLSRLDWSTDALLIAEADDAWVALHSLSLYNRETGAVRVPFTGTLPTYRGRGIASVLKIRGAGLLQSKGGRAILTANRVENVPILAINRALGFISGPLELTYARHVP